MFFSSVVDWWSFGVLIYELLTGASPFTVEGEKNTQQEISKRILRAQPPMPSNLSSDVQSLLQMILVKDPRKRLGGGIKDADELKRHPFFKSINWSDLAARRTPAPFTPKIANELDVSNFSEEFTSMVPNLSILLADNNNNKPQQDAQWAATMLDNNNNSDDEQDLFHGYSYVAPSIQLDDGGGANPNPLLLNNTATNGHVINAHHHRLKPDITKLVENSKCPNSNEFFKHYNLMLGQKCADVDTHDNGWLGDGSFSVCCRCIHKKSGVEYAVKIVSRHRRRDSVNGSMYDASLNEVELLRACQGHRNIVTLKEVFHSEQYTFIVLELLSGGELLSRIRKRTRFTEIEACHVFRKLVSALAFMHSKGIVHRDLKPEVCLQV